MMMMSKRAPELVPLDGPAMPAPPGMHSNFVNPSNLNSEGLVIMLICLTLSMLVVGMRIWTKIRWVRQVVLEDWVSCLALALFAVLCSMSYLSLDHGAGVHQWNVRLKDISSAKIFAKVGSICYCVDLFLIKLAILFQFLRVFVPLKNRDMMFWACHALIWLNLTYYIVYICLAIFACRPVKKGWSQKIPPMNGTCLDLRDAYIAAAAINTASDLSIVILPQHIIWNMQLSSGKKMGLSAVFLIGLFGCACSAVRLFYSVNSLHYHDHTYLGGVLTLWGIGETTAGILALCLPLLPKFFQGVQGSQMWFRFRRIRLHPSFNRSKTPLVRAAEIKPIVPPASKAKANGERIIRDDSCTRISDFSS